ncbi:MAG: DUF362 domain-containing protein [Candidatus Eisenbacteria bacterium]|nr:DUF362 domain-containing protein [Candidatus Eisenbacteria bacterium]
MKSFDHISRREFLKRSAALGAQTALISSGIGLGVGCGAGCHTTRAGIDLAVAKGDSPVKNCLAAVEAIGGFPKFVSAGNRVVIKPNPIGRNQPDLATNTHPDMIEAVIKGCLAAGASEVLVVSHDDLGSMEANGTAAAVERGGGILKSLMRQEEYREIVVPRGKILRTEQIAEDILDADLFINMPIAKHHAATEVTLSMKNLMGINWDRVFFHQTDLHRCIAELTSLIRQDLIIMDANHVLMTNGPSGPGEVHLGRQVIAGVDPVAVDAFTTQAFFREPDRIDHIRIAHELGVGEIDLAKLKIHEFEV